MVIISNINKDQFVRMIKAGLINQDVLKNAKISEKESSFEVGGKKAILVDIAIEDKSSVSGADYLATVTGAQGTKAPAVDEAKPADTHAEPTAEKPAEAVAETKPSALSKAAKR